MNDTEHAFIASLPERRRHDAEVLLALMRRATGEEPEIDGVGAGFGRYHYRYASGHEGESPASAFAMRKQAITVYLMDGVSAHTADLAGLGPHKEGVGCIYLRSLEGIDLTILERVVRRSHATLTAGVYPLRARDGGG